MKRNYLLAIALIAALCSATAAQARDSEKISVVVNGEEISFEGDQEPVIENSRTLVPFRLVLEKMGAEVSWDKDTQRVDCSLNGKNVSLVIGSDKMTAGEEEITLDAPAKIIGSRTMVPIRAISEGLGAAVDWNNEERLVSITILQEEPLPRSEVPLAPLEEASVSYSFKTLTDDITQGDKTIFKITAEYPVLEGDTEGIKKANQAIEADVKARVSACHAEYAVDASEIAAEYTDLSCDIKYDVKYADTSLISMYITQVTFLGGAHPSTEIGGLTLSLENGEAMTAEDFGENAVERAIAGIKAMAEENPEEYPFYNEETFVLNKNNFYIDGSQLVFVVPRYEIAPYARGEVEYRIDLEGI